MEYKSKNIKLVLDILKIYSIKEISKKLNLAIGTIKRWIELKNVPNSYTFDLLKILSIKIDYSQYSSKEKDQIFTPLHTAQYCYEKFTKKMEELGENIEDYYYIEPSAGDGSFMRVLPINKTIGMDIEPRGENIEENDFLEWTPSAQDVRKYIVFGNPPFGLRGHLALKFINHSYNFSDYVCFILPQLFESDGKGSPRKRVIGYNLIHSEILVTSFYEPDNSEINVNTIFQIWSKKHTDIRYSLYPNVDTKNELLKVYSLSNGGTSSSTRNKKMLDKCDIYLPSTCFGKENMRLYNCFNDLPDKRGYGVVFHIVDKEKLIEKAQNIDWSNISFLSTNSAYNLRSSKIYSQFKTD